MSLEKSELNINGTSFKGVWIAIVMTIIGTLLTALVVFFGLFPEQILALSQVGSDQVLNPVDYIDSVFPPTGDVQ